MKFKANIVLVGNSVLLGLLKVIQELVDGTGGEVASEAFDVECMKGEPAPVAGIVSKPGSARPRRRRGVQKHKDNGDPRLVWNHPEHGRKTISVTESLKNMGITEEQLLAQKWKKGTAEHTIRLALAIRRSYAERRRKAKQVDLLIKK
jgi:hypothetical protein